MIRVKHPLESCNVEQEKLIANMRRDEKMLNELMFSYGNASYRYHAISKDFKPTVEDYNEWLSGLDPDVKKGMKEKGFSGCLGVLSFTRYVNEKNDIGMDEYVKNLMGVEDFNSYMEIVTNEKPLFKNKL